MIEIDVEKFLLPRKSVFTERELEVMKAISEHFNNQSVARLLRVREDTVKDHVVNILDKIYARAKIDGYNTRQTIEDVYRAVMREIG